MNTNDTTTTPAATDTTPDMLSYLPICAGVIITSAGPWESAIPGILHDDFARSGVTALLRALDIPHTWNTPDATTEITTGDLVHLDPTTRTILGPARRLRGGRSGRIVDLPRQPRQQVPWSRSTSRQPSCSSSAPRGRQRERGGAPSTGF